MGRESEEDNEWRIREAAYFRAERRHFAPGHSVEDWVAVEASEARPIWRFVGIDEYAPPSAPTELPNQRSMTSKGLGRLWRRFRGAPPTHDVPQVDEGQHPVSEALLSPFVASPVWDEAAMALEEALAPRLDTKAANARAVVVIGPPHGAASEILAAWAGHRGCRVIEPPSPEQILAQDDAWLGQLDAGSPPWVLTGLERCYLRHTRGLSLVQRLLAMLASDSGHRCVVGCDSWTWAYLSQVPPGTLRLLRPLVAQALDAERLGRWLQRDATGEAPRLLVRETDGGEPVLPDPAPGEGGDEETREPSGFLRHLAAYSLGIPLVARAIWIDALRRATDAFPEGEPEATTGPHPEIRVPAWRRLELPTLPDNARDHAIVLHTLLLHDGLADNLLPLLLPLSAAQITHRLHQLRDAGVVEAVDDRWRVSAAGYPAVRKFLRGDGYLIDAIAG